MKKRSVFWACVVLLTVFSACKKIDYYDAETAKEMMDVIYAANFQTMVGVVPDDFSWDASTGERKWRATTTRLAAEDITFSTTDDFMMVDQGVLDYLNSTLIESQNNKSKYGRTFVMTVPDNEFTIMPIYQGKARTQGFDFYVVVDNVPVKIWTKSQDLEVCDATYKRFSKTSPWQLASIGSWHTVRSLDSKNQMDANTIQTTEFYNSSNQVVSKESDAIQKVVKNYQVRAKGYTFDLSQYAGSVMSFYLEITASNNSVAADKGTMQSSTNGMMVALEQCPTPVELEEEGCKAMIIGCEAANKQTDWDMNDIVFLVYGRPYPPVVVEIRDERVDHVLEKRYMFEDLGSTDDFDFNDVVMDLYDIETVQMHYENGILTSETVVGTRQEGHIRHLGGTIPIELYIGDRMVWSGGSLNTFDMDVEIELNPDENGSLGWKPEENNVGLRALQRIGEDMEEGTDIFTNYVSAFPTLGHKAPMIIATDTDIDWMLERVTITMDWFNQVAKREGPVYPN